MGRTLRTRTGSSEPHELRFEGPATAFGLRGTVRLGWLDDEDRNALVERITQLMA
jgi:hypothetical protein